MTEERNHHHPGGQGKRATKRHVKRLPASSGSMREGAPSLPCPRGAGMSGQGGTGTAAVSYKANGLEQGSDGLVRARAAARAISAAFDGVRTAASPNGLSVRLHCPVPAMTSTSPARTAFLPTCRARGDTGGQT